MAGNYVKHKLHEEWGIGKLDSDAAIVGEKIVVEFDGKFKVLVKPKNLEVVGFYD